jgi:hypothetical protein
LTNKKINVVINVTEEIDNFHENNLGITYYRFPIKDNNHDDISEILEQTYGAPMEVLIHGGMPVVVDGVGADIAERMSRLA